MGCRTATAWRFPLEQPGGFPSELLVLQHDLEDAALRPLEETDPISPGLRPHERLVPHTTEHGGFAVAAQEPDPDQVDGAEALLGEGEGDVTSLILHQGDAEQIGRKR